MYNISESQFNFYSIEFKKKQKEIFFISQGLSNLFPFSDR